MSVRSRGDSGLSLRGVWEASVSPALTPGFPGLVACAGGGGAVKWEVEGAAESCASGVRKRGLQSGEGPDFLSPGPSL